MADDQILAQQPQVHGILSELEAGLKEKVERLVAERH
jgi:hypothetical protein